MSVTKGPKGETDNVTRFRAGELVIWRHKGMWRLARFLGYQRVRHERAFGDTTLDEERMVFAVMDSTGKINLVRERRVTTAMRPRRYREEDDEVLLAGDLLPPALHHLQDDMRDFMGQQRAFA